MKILFISPELPWPLDTGGKIRSFNILKELAKEHQIILLCFGNIENYGPLKDYCQRIYTVPFNLGLVKKIFNLLRSFISEKPMKVLNFYSSSFKKELLKILKKEKPDVLYFEHIYMAQYLNEISQKNKYFKIFDTHNIYFRFFKSLSKSKNWLKAFANKSQITKMKDYEAKIAASFDLVCVCSEGDKKSLLESAPAAKIEIVPNGVDLSLYKDLKITEKENNLLFIGSFDHFPNEEGVVWFIQKIFPKIKEMVPDITLTLVGRKPPSSVLKFEKDPTVKVLGYIEDIRSYLQKSKALIVPLLSGGGTRLKILEAMAAKIPVVSTKIGAEGLEVLDGQNILIADSEEEFAQKVIQLLLDERLSQNIIKNAFYLVKKEYDWSVCAQKLRKILCQLS